MEDYGSIESQPVNDYESRTEQDVLSEMKERLNNCWTDWDRIYRKGRECCDMIAGRIFPEEVRAQRIAEGRPIIEVPQLTQYTERVLGDMRQNPPAIKYRATTPYTAGKAKSLKTEREYETTEIASSIAKEIEQKSNAVMWYDRAATQMVHAGVGWLRIYPCYKSDDSFDITLRVSGVTNFDSCLLDFNAREPDFSDARYGFVLDTITRKEFEARWPDATPSSVNTRQYAGRIWSSTDTVTVAEYFERVAETSYLFQLSDGTVIENDKDEEPPVPPGVEVVNKRKTSCYKVVWRKCSADAILEGGIDGIEMPFSEIPLVCMFGRESLSKEGRNFESLIVHAMDAQREASYWRTMMTEQVALQPKAKWVATNDMVESRRDDWERANTVPIDVLTYDADPLQPGIQPQRVQPAQIAAAEMQQYISSVQDMKACIGLYDSAIGNISGEISGRAILAKERQTDIGTYVYVAHRDEAVRRIGRLMLEGIKEIYTDTMTVRIFLPDETTDFVQINAPVLDGESEDGFHVENDITEAELETYVDSGPAYSTLRIEAVNSLMEMAQANPQILNMAGDIMAMNMDWPGAKQFAERLKRSIFATTPQILSPNEAEELIKEQGQVQPPPPTPQSMVDAQIAQSIAQGEQAKAQKAAADAQKEIAKASHANTEAEIAQAQIDEENRIRLMVGKAIAEFLQQSGLDRNLQ